MPNCPKCGKELHGKRSCISCGLELLCEVCRVRHADLFFFRIGKMLCEPCYEEVFCASRPD